MQIIKKDVNKTLIFFLFAHMVVWTLVPSLSNANLPLDNIEALAWSSDFQFGYSKHPPLSAWFPGFFYLIFGSQDLAYYLLSQIFVVLSFVIVFKFSQDFFNKKIFSLISVLLLEGIYFYNFTSPEFNVNVCQLPFWALTVLYCWKGCKDNKIIDWLLFGLFAALGVLSKYLFIYLLAAMDVFFIYLLVKKKINYKCLISLITFFLILSPHLIWLVDNNYTTITYAMHRTGTDNSIFFKDHFLNPLIFAGKQIGILIPFFIMFLFIISKLKVKFNFRDRKMLFLLTINIVPIILIFLTSLFMGAKIRTMWMTPFYLFSGVLLVYIFQSKIVLKKFKYFFSIFLVLFIFSPAAYLYISITQIDKRTNYPGKEIAKKVQEKWDENFSNKITLVGGDEWHGGNLSYHLKSRPKWDYILDNKRANLFDNEEGGFILIGDKDILSKICSGIFFTVLDNKKMSHGICMFGKRL